MQADCFPALKKSTLAECFPALVKKCNFSGVFWVRLPICPPIQYVCLACITVIYINSDTLKPVYQSAIQEPLLLFERMVSMTTQGSHYQRGICPVFVCTWLSVTYINDSCMGLGKAEEVNILTVVDTEFLHWLLRFWKLV